MAQWGSQLDQIYDKCISRLENSARVYTSNCEGDDLSEGIDKLKSCMEVYCQTTNESAARQEALNRVQNNPDASQLSKDYEKEYAELLKGAKKSKTSKQYKEFVLMINASIRRNAAAGSVDEGDDLDIQETGEDTEGNVDPWTRMVIQNPVQHTKCGHVYEYSSVMEQLRHSRTRCPVVGCKFKGHLQSENLQQI